MAFLEVPYLFFPFDLQRTRKSTSGDSSSLRATRIKRLGYQKGKPHPNPARNPEEFYFIPVMVEKGVLKSPLGQLKQEVLNHRLGEKSKSTNTNDSRQSVFYNNLQEKLSGSALKRSWIVFFEMEIK